MAADLELVRRLAKADGLAVVATTRSDGSIHATVVNAGVTEDPVTGSPAIGFVVRGSARKLTYLRRSRPASVVFRNGWEWAAVEGPVRIAGPDDPLDGFNQSRLPQLLRDVFIAAGGSHDDWDAYDRVMAEERRTAVLVAPDRILTNAQ